MKFGVLAGIEQVHQCIEITYLILIFFFIPADLGIKFSFLLFEIVFQIFAFLA